MKNTNLIILFILSLTLFACHKDKEFDKNDPVVSEVTQTVSANQATFSWQVDLPGKFQTAVEVSEKESMADLKHVEGTKEEDKYTAVVKDLTAGTQYYYRVVVWNKFNRFEEEVKSFETTENPQPPQDTTFYTISLSCQPEEGGTASGGGTFAEGDTCTITAAANVGYTFVNWTENGSQVSADLEYTFAVMANRSLVANFSAEDYIISVEIEPENGGTITGAGGYNYGDECTLTAAANEGYDFKKWTKNGEEVSTNTLYTFTVTETAEFVAHFQIQRYTISVAADPEDGGMVEGDGTYEYGQTCTVKATEAEGYHFVNWTEDGGQVSSNVEYTFTVNDNRSLVANFSAEDYIISVEIEPENGGTVTGAGGYNYGDECTLTATPSEGYDFTEWTQNGTQISTEHAISFTVTESASYKAHFQAKSYTISVSAEPSNGGNVTGGGDYHYGEECTLTATANEGYDFDHWTKNGSQISGGVTINVTVTANAIYVAHFNAQSYTITTQSNPTGSGTVSGGGSYTYGQNCTLTADAYTVFGYTFDHWTKDGSTISGGATINFVVTENATYDAYFIKQSYTITTQSNPTNGGSVSGGGSYTHGQNCTLTAFPNTGYTFDHWTKNGSQISGGVTITFSVYETATYIAYFSVRPEAPIGAIDGLFTINGNGDKVFFSQGNLQYIGSASTPYWKFADHQWDYLGTTTNQNSTNQNVDRDLFGWGTSGWSGSGATYYRPWDTNHSGNGSLYGPYGNYDLTGPYANADWGVYNTIYSGGIATNGWRTLTGDDNGEWDYIFNTRGASIVNGVVNARFVKAKVADVYGVILFPDSYTHPSGVAQPVGINELGDMGWNGNNYSSTDFGLMEQNGAVFLPAAGYRVGTSVNGVGSNGYYWSSSYYNSIDAYSVNFYSGFIYSFYYGSRPRGQSVRLVTPVEN